LRRGLRCTGVTVSRNYLEARAKTLGFDWEIIFADVREGSGMAQHEPVARIKATLPTDAQDSANF
jgi:hypothetical protein